MHLKNYISLSHARVGKLTKFSWRNDRLNNNNLQRKFLFEFEFLFKKGGVIVPISIFS